jgi:hypothetical protein
MSAASEPTVLIHGDHGRPLRRVLDANVLASELLLAIITSDYISKADGGSADAESDQF